MTYVGQIVGGVVVFQNERPPEGAAVRVEVVASEEKVSTSVATKPPDIPTIWERLREFSGVVDDLPPDFALNHDHYIHGAPKKPT